MNVQNVSPATQYMSKRTAKTEQSNNCSSTNSYEPNQVAATEIAIDHSMLDMEDINISSTSSGDMETDNNSNSDDSSMDLLNSRCSETCIDKENSELDFIPMATSTPCVKGKSSRRGRPPQPLKTLNQTAQNARLKNVKNTVRQHAVYTCTTKRN